MHTKLCKVVCSQCQQARRTGQSKNTYSGAGGINAIDLDAINKAHEDKIAVESESKGALDGAKARREAEVQSYKDKITKLTAEQEDLKKKLEEKEKQEDFLKNEKRN